MAIDSAAKRSSVLGVLLPCSPRYIAPDSSIDQGDRQDVSWVYRGILAGAAAVMALQRIHSYVMQSRYSATVLADKYRAFVMKNKYEAGDSG